MLDISLHFSEIIRNFFFGELKSQCHLVQEQFVTGGRGFKIFSNIASSLFYIF